MKKHTVWKKMLALALASSMLAGCSGGSNPAGNQTTSAQAAGTEAVKENGAADKTITLAMVSAWDTLIPFDTTSSYSDLLLDLIYDKLVYLKQDGTYEPRLASSWEMSADNKVLTLHLNENAKWQDGEPVTAKDVEFTCKIYNSPTVQAVRQNNVSPFAG